MIPTLQDLAGMDSHALQRAIVAIDDELQTLDVDENGELRQLDAKEEKRLEALVSLRSRCEAHIHVREQFNRNPDAFRRAPGLVTKTYIPEQVHDWQTEGGTRLSDSALRMLEARGKDMAPEAIDRVEKTIRTRLSADNPNLDGEYVARRLLITESDEYRSAFQQAMTSSNPLYTEGEVKAIRAYRENEARAMGEVTGSAGGFGVPVTLDPTITLSSGAAAAPVWEAAKKIPVTSNTYKTVTSGPVTFAFQTEAAVTTDNSPTLVQPSITVHMARAFVPYSIEVGQDYASFAQEIEDLLAAGWIDMVASKTITGSGTGEPFGIVTRLDATAASEVLVTTAGTVDAAQLFKVWNALPERFRTNAKWLMSVSQESNIRSFGATANPSPYFTIDLNQGGITTLNGRPNMVTDYAETFVSGSANHHNHLTVGDFSNYVIAMRQGLTVEPVQHVFQQQTAGTGIGFPTGQRGFFAWGRWGADATVTNSFRLLNQT